MSILFSSKYGDEPGVEKVLCELRTMIGHDRWFIAGSYAHPEVKRPNDIDVFFIYEKDHANACFEVGLVATASGHPIVHVTPEATTYYLDSLQKRVQLVSKHYGTPEKVLTTFDINVCKRAILPCGRRVSHQSASLGLRVDTLNAGTFMRYFKYIFHLGLEHQLEKKGKVLIDNYIEDSTIIVAFYKGRDVSEPANKALFKEAIKYDVLKDYAYEQAAKHAPELLI